MRVMLPRRRQHPLVVRRLSIRDEKHVRKRSPFPAGLDGARHASRLEPRNELARDVPGRAAVQPGLKRIARPIHSNTARDDRSPAAAGGGLANHETTTWAHGIGRAIEQLVLCVDGEIVEDVDEENGVGGLEGGAAHVRLLERRVEADRGVIRDRDLLGIPIEAAEPARCRRIPRGTTRGARGPRPMSRMSPSGAERGDGLRGGVAVRSLIAT